MQGWGAMPQIAIGRRISRLRDSRGLTQQQLADALGMSLAWVKKFEAGDLQADPRISTLKRIAEVLGVPISLLLEEDEPATAPHDSAGDTAVLRAVLLAPQTEPKRHGDLEAIWRRCEHGFSAFQAGDYGALLNLLPDLVTVSRTLPDDPASARCAYRVHHLASVALMKYDGGAAAWHAGQRALDLAKASGGPVVTALAAQAMVYTMTSIGEASIGMDHAVSYAEELAPALSDGSIPGSTALGMLWLKAAVAAAACNEARSAEDMLAHAKRCAQHVPLSTNFLMTGFDQANVWLYQVSINAALARYGPAANGADQLSDRVLASVPRERRTHHRIEAAATYAVLNRVEDALEALLKAEDDNPQELRSRPAAREVITSLTEKPGPVPDRLRELARRTGIKA